MLRSVVVGVWIAASNAAWAKGPVCTVAFQEALPETAAGRAAKQTLDETYERHRKELMALNEALERNIERFQRKDDTAPPPEAIAQQQAELQQQSMQSQAALEQLNARLLGDLEGKMREVSAAVGKARGCAVVLDRAAVVYAGPDVVDLTDAVVTRFDTEHPPKG